MSVSVKLSMPELKIKAKGFVIKVWERAGMSEEEWRSLEFIEQREIIDRINERRRK